MHWHPSHFPEWLLRGLDLGTSPTELFHFAPLQLYHSMASQFRSIDSEFHSRVYHMKSQFELVDRCKEHWLHCWNSMGWDWCCWSQHWWRMVHLPRWLRREMFRLRHQRDIWLVEQWMDFGGTRSTSKRCWCCRILRWWLRGGSHNRWRNWRQE